MPRETGVSAQGSFSPSKVEPQDIDRAYSAAERVDSGSQMPEAGQVPFHNKMASEGRLAALRDLGLSKIANAPANISPSSIKPPAPFKPVPTYDTRTDKPPGYNLTSGVQTMSNGADVNDSYGAFNRRLQGSPV